MTKKQMTLIYYYVPQDHDDPQYPNVFGIMVPKANITYSQIQKNFPLRGQYIFRFKIMHENNIVWLDLADKGSKLPTYKDRIFVKATRVTWEGDMLGNGKQGEIPVVKKESHKERERHTEQVDLL